jgi:hypothetical protein
MVHNKTTEIGSQLSSFCLNMYDCVKPSMAERMWENQQTGDLELNRMSACKTFLIMVLLHQFRELYGRIAAQNQLNCRGSRRHSCITHHKNKSSISDFFCAAPHEFCV